MTILVIGQERTGTHTFANMIKASGVSSIHEDRPTLCFEAYNRVVKGTCQADNLSAKIKNIKGKSEANHRLQFFVDIFAKEIPDAKFIFLIRDPVNVICSLIGTMAHWPGRTNLPKWYFERTEKYTTPEKREFNLYRIPPIDFKQPLAIMHLQSWLRGLKVSLPLLENLGDRLKIVRTGKICPEGQNIWNWLGLNWNDQVAKAACHKTDSMYEMFGNDNLAGWAKEQVHPHVNRIHEEFNEILGKYPLGKRILSLIYHKG